MPYQIKYTDDAQQEAWVTDYLGNRREFDTAEDAKRYGRTNQLQPFSVVLVTE